MPRVSESIETERRLMGFLGLSREWDIKNEEGVWVWVFFGRI